MTSSNPLVSIRLVRTSVARAWTGSSLGICAVLCLTTVPYRALCTAVSDTRFFMDNANARCLLVNAVRRPA
jgi:hypothetical protein